MNRSTLFLLIFSFVINISFSQKTLIYLSDESDFNKGIELFQKQKYGSAQKVFQQFIASKNNNYLKKTDAEYYSSICAIELFNKDGEIQLKKFIENHPESPKVKTAYFYLGKNNYRKKKYDESIKWFEKVEIYDLNNDEIAELYFKRGYSYFEVNKFEKAKTDLYEIKDVDTKYTPSANYYYSHISYLQKNYETALQGFLKLTRNENFGSIVPYYIAQLYYLQGKYDKVISYAPALLDSANVKRAPEIARIIGEAYYNMNRFVESIPFLKKYEKGVGGNLPRKDMYQLGYAYYKGGDIENAISHFDRITGSEEDSLAQNAYYHLADCYIKKGNKQSARNAFLTASKINMDQQIKEDALYSYAKLSYELSFNPFSDAIKAFQNYIELYPNSPRNEEAYAFLVNAFLTTKNYSSALQYIERIKNLSPELKSAYQKIAYFHGVEFFNNSLLDSATKLFDKALIYKSDKTINALALYWKGEIFYRKKSFPEAIDQYKEFQQEPGAFGLTEYNNANYNVGYAYFQQKNYSDANIWFRKYVSNKNVTNTKKLNDAYIRIGDTYFMMKDYAGAAENYAQAIKLKVFDTDYAYFQRALCLGIEKKQEEKETELIALINTFPKSNYAAAAKFELGKSFLVTNNNEKSIEYFSKVINEHPNSSYVNKSLLQIGLIQYNNKHDDQALITLDKLVRKERKSEEANQAIDFIKKLYIAKGDVDGLEKYFNEISATIPLASLDTVAYEVAKERYDEGDCKGAVNDFNKYIQKFSEGIFIIDANFYKAECDYNAGNLDAALVGYSFISTKNKNVYTEQALVKTSYINFKNKNFQAAFNYYSKLDSIAEYPKNIMDARIGKMRCSYLLKNYKEAIDNVNKVLITEKISNEVFNEAHITLARSAFELEQYDLALQEFNFTSSNAISELGSEAKYNVAYIQFLKAEFKDSEKTIFELIGSDPSYPQWMTKGLILLSDNYMAMNDVFQAKHTLKTVIEESKIPELTKIAVDKYYKIQETEKSKIPKLSLDELKIEFKENKVEYDHLFVEPKIEDEPVRNDE